MGIDQLSLIERVAPDTAGEIPEGEAVVKVSDGTDEYSNGDVVVVANRNGTLEASVLGNLDNGNGLISVDSGISGDLGGLL